MDFDPSPKVRALQARLAAFMTEHVYPNEARMLAQIADGDRWQPIPLQAELKAHARAAGLWNLFLPESDRGAGLTNLEYAPLCEIMGRSPFAPEIFNCSAPGHRQHGGTRPLRHAGAASSAGSNRCWPARSARRSR